uniref:MRJP1_3 protein n=1 Tax=Fopius arisanus TaxID=64838 RepID=A0A0C9S0B6_9HYME
MWSLLLGIINNRMRGALGVTFCLLSLVSAVLGGCRKEPLSEFQFQLSGTKLEWPCSSTKSIYSSTGRYIARNVIVTRMQIYKDEAIVAMPRLKPGTPFTLGVVPLRKKAGGSSVSPFPCWSIQEEGNCAALQSVVDIFLDAQDILWALDTGIVNTLTQPVRRCQPKVVAFSVKTGKVVKIVELSELVDESSRLQQIIVDYAPDGRVFLYISDASNRSIIVYEAISDTGLTVTLPKAVSLGSNHRDVLYMALARKYDGTTVLYFTYLGSSRVFSIKADYLRKGNTDGYIVDVGPKIGKIVFLGTDNGSNIFFRRKGDSDIYMWNTDTSMKLENFILVQKGNDCRLSTHVVPGYKKLMWTLDSNIQDYIQNTVPCSGASINIHPIVNQDD